jgi:hypothetical protein
MTVFRRHSSWLLSTLYQFFLICGSLFIGIEIQVAYSNPSRLAIADRTCAITDDRHIFCWPLGRTGPSDEAIVSFSELSLENDEVDSISVSDTHVCVLTISGQARCALMVGLSSVESRGSLFDGQWLHGPMHEDVRQVCAGSFFTCAIISVRRNSICKYC